MKSFDFKRQGSPGAKGPDNTKFQWILGALQSASSCVRRHAEVRARLGQDLTPEDVRGKEGVVMLRKVRTHHSLIGFGILAAASAVPLACSDDMFSGCDASRTCPPPSKGGETGSGGEAGGETARGGSSGSGTGGRAGAGAAGAAGADDGGHGGSATGGTANGGEAGSGDDAGASGEGGTGVSGDRPTVVSVSPADGEIGVALDTNLVITFSKPMDRMSVEAAFLSQGIPTSGVSFAWNPNSTILTVNPTNDLTYDEVTSPTDAEPNYTVSITDDAEDASGNRLADNLDWSFRTIREVTQTIPVPHQNVFHMAGEGSAPSPCVNPTNMGIVGEGPNHLLISADITSLPSGIAEWQAATLSATQLGAQGTPFGSSAENLGVVHAHDENVMPPTSVAWMPLGTEVGVFSSSPAAELKSVNVLAPLVEDYANRTARGQRSQYRLAFDRLTNNNGFGDGTAYSCNAFSLTARYLIP